VLFATSHRQYQEWGNGTASQPPDPYWLVWFSFASGGVRRMTQIRCLGPRWHLFLNNTGSVSLPTSFLFAFWSWGSTGWLNLAAKFSIHVYTCAQKSSRVEYWAEVRRSDSCALAQRRCGARASGSRADRAFGRMMVFIMSDYKRVWRGKIDGQAPFPGIVKLEIDGDYL